MGNRSYRVEELTARGGLYFENIQQGFSDCRFRIRKLNQEKAVEYLRILWKRNGEEDSFVDFYYGNLQEEERRRVRAEITEEEAAYLDQIDIPDAPVFLRLDEKLLEICAKLNDKEALFSTFYFTRYPCTLWGNYNQEYVEFCPKKRKLGAVLFDMDGLMYDTERVVKRSWDEAGERMGCGRLGDHIFHTLGMNLKRRREYFRSVYGQEFPFEEFTEIYRAISHRILETEGIPVKKGLYELLDYLDQKGILCAVATSSSSRHAFGNLEKTGLRSRFRTVISGDEVTKSKPDPEIYEKAMAALGVEGGETLVLEDSRNGLCSALAAGALPIMIPDLLRDLPDVEPFLEGKLQDLEAVIEYLDENFG